MNQNQVELKQLSFNDLMTYNINIPDYQRMYCWTEKNVSQLWEDIRKLNKEYHLGNVIVQQKDNYCEIIDGQQRITTLCLICKELNNNENTELVNICDIEKFLCNKRVSSAKEKEYIAYNKYLINFHVSKIDLQERKIILESLLKQIKFSVLILIDGNLDLAYTFFSNQNSAGKPLTNFDLLKAHHLRYVEKEAQAVHLASRWDAHYSSNENGKKNINQTLGIYVYRLRKWMRKKNWNELATFRIKEEYEAAAIIADIPPFGEQFHFNEKIQGGTHFFAYTENLVRHYNAFSNLTEFKALSKALQYESHWRYRDIIETLLFGYYLKFGTMYITEALVCIEKVVSHHRLITQRAILSTILKYATETEVILIIEQSTSPTFFLAEMLDKINRNAVSNTLYVPIIRRYRSCIDSMYKNISKEIEEIEIHKIKSIVGYDK